VTSDHDRAVNFLSIWCDDVARRDPVAALTDLVGGDGWPTVPSVNVFLRSAFKDWEPEAALFAPGTLLIEATGPPVYFRDDFYYAMAYGEFCDYVEAYLEDHYVSTHPAEAGRIRDLLRQLRDRLAATP